MIRVHYTCCKSHLKIQPEDPLSIIDYASDNGHVAILDWWRRSGLKLKWSEYAIDYASKKGHIAVLDWWRRSGLEMKWTSDATGHADILEWWRESGLEMKWSYYNYETDYARLYR